MHRVLKIQGPDDRNWYVVATASGEAEAAIIKGLLETADIPVWITRESAGAAIGLGVGLLGTVTIMVPETHYDEAMTLLEIDDSVEEIDLAGDDDDDFVIDQDNPA
jgi:hypothetical protein